MGWTEKVGVDIRGIGESEGARSPYCTRDQEKENTIFFKEGLLKNGLVDDTTSVYWLILLEL